MSPRLAFAIEVARRAGRLTLAYFQNGAEVEYKSDRSPVTEADRQAEQSIRLAIAQHFPNDGILGEEYGEAGSPTDRWVIDPIDGTKSFTSGVPLYATLIGFESNRTPILGVAYFPALDEMIYAERGSGCFWNGAPCRVSDKAELESAVIACGSHVSMERCGRTAGMLRLAEQVIATRTWGDAYGHGLVATGRVEAMIDPTIKRWDVSAMKVIVEEAGGLMTDFAGGKDWVREAISTTPALHSKILEAFRG